MATETMNKKRPRVVDAHVEIADRYDRKPTGLRTKLDKQLRTEFPAEKDRATSFTKRDGALTFSLSPESS